MTVELLLAVPPQGSPPTIPSDRVKDATSAGTGRAQAFWLGPARVAVTPGGAVPTLVSGWLTGEAAVTPALPQHPPVTGVVVAVDEVALARARTHSHPEELGAETGHVRVVADAHGLTVTNDGVGRVPLYWSEHDGWLLASTSLGALVRLGLPMRWDDTGVLEYLAMLHPLGERTVLHNASLLPAGATLRRRWDGATRVSSRPLFHPRDDEARSDDDVVSDFARRWRHALEDLVERRRGRRIAVGLSGGLDSRVIAHGLASVGARPLALTYGDDGNREMRVARTLAGRLGLPHLALPLTDDVLLAHAEECATRLDGAHSPAQMYEAWFGDRLGDVADVLVSGLAAGPAWGNDKALGLPAHALPDVLSRRVLGGLHAASGLLAPLAAGSAETAIRADVTAGLQRWPQHRPDLAVFWNMDNRQRRWGLMLPVDAARHGLCVEAPFLDARVVALTAALTPQQRRHGSAYLRVHRELLTSVADVARTDDGNAPASLTHVYWSGNESLAVQLGQLARHHPLAAGRRITREARRRAASSAGPSSSWARRELAAADVFSPAVLMQRPQYRERLARLVAEGLAGVPDVVDSAAVQQAVQALLEGPARMAVDPRLLAQVATLGIWGTSWSQSSAGVTGPGRDQGAGSAAARPTLPDESDAPPATPR